MKKVIITTSWDDGHILDLKLADLLEKYAIKGTFYVSPKDREIDKNKILNEAQIKNLSKKFEVGAHTITHPRLSKVSEKDSENEIRGSKEYLAKVTGNRIISFCYPGGDYNQTHINQVRKAGFKFARTTKRFAVNIGGRPLEVPTSIHAYRHWSDVMEIIKVSNFNPIKFINYCLNWDNLAKAFFDRVYKNGGVFHLWGHSWEIDKNKDWQRLENVLKYIDHRSNTKYLTNGELI